jgi:hypothetical protein
VSELRAKLEKWAKELTMRGFHERPKSAFEMLDLVWPVIEAVESCVGCDDAEKPEISALGVILTLNKALAALAELEKELG